MSGWRIYYPPYKMEEQKILASYQIEEITFSLTMDLKLWHKTTKYFPNSFVETTSHGWNKNSEWEKNVGRKKTDK